MSLRARLLVLAALVTLVLAGLAGWRYLHDRARDLAAGKSALTATAAGIVHELDERIQNTAQLLVGVAQAQALDTADRVACSAFLAEVRGANTQYTGILTINPDGRLFCDSLQTGRELDLTDRAYFRAAKGLEAGVALEPAFGRLTGTSVLQIAHPARSESGALRFVLLASFNLQNFAAGLHRDHQDADILMIDAAGTALVWRSGEGQAIRPGESIAESALFRFAKVEPGPHVGELNGPAAGALEDADGPPEIWAVAPPSLASKDGLIILVGLPKARLVAAAQQRLIQDGAILAAIALLLFGGAWAVPKLGRRQA